MSRGEDVFQNILVEVNCMAADWQSMRQ